MTALAARHPAYPVGAALALVTTIGAAATFFVDGVLRGPAVMQGSARGTALVMLAVAVPALLAGMWLARRGSVRGVLAWLGALGYLIYNAVMLLFGTPFNRLFLFYVAILGLALAGTISLLCGLDVPALAERLREAPARAIAVYVWVIAAANALIWLRVVVPGLGAEGAPAFLDGTGLLTNPIYVQDLAFWLPLAGLSARWLWRRTAWGYVVVGGLLGMWLIEAIGVTSDQWFGHRADPASTVATLGGAYLFAVIAVVNAVAITLFLRLRRRGRAA
ncbi:MAG: hypothetical protein WAL50_20880 [Kineosporiaceae bacterium]